VEALGDRVDVAAANARLRRLAPSPVEAASVLGTGSSGGSSSRR
jgi:hypothetical protein